MRYRFPDGRSGDRPGWNFQFLGTKDLLVPVADRDFARLYSPEGTLPNSGSDLDYHPHSAGLLRFIVAYRTPKVARYPESCLLFRNDQNFATSYYFNFDIKRKLWNTNPH